MVQTTLPDHVVPDHVREIDPDLDVRLEVKGEIDLACREHFRRALEDLVNRADEYVAVDLSAVSFIDSAALGVLVAVRNAASTRGIAVVLVEPSAPCRKVLELTGLVELFEIR